MNGKSKPYHEEGMLIILIFRITSVCTLVNAGQANLCSAGSLKQTVQSWSALSQLPDFSQEINVDFKAWEKISFTVYKMSEGAYPLTQVKVN